mmetsp:Transcript_8378/g.15687  ORF Transcript_8378/g.15687 Transcript_8378/m.15687 type:complete len:227 (-) Transcript_8378:697-1377(-)
MVSCEMPGTDSSAKVVQTKPTSMALENSAGEDRCNLSISAPSGNTAKSFSRASCLYASVHTSVVTGAKAMSSLLSSLAEPREGLFTWATSICVWAGTKGEDATLLTGSGTCPPRAKKLTQVSASASSNRCSRPIPRLSRQETPTAGASSCRRPSARALTNAMEPPKAHAPATPGDAPGGAPTSRIRPLPLAAMSLPKRRQSAAVVPMLYVSILFRSARGCSMKGPV